MAAVATVDVKSARSKGLRAREVCCHGSDGRLPGATSAYKRALKYTASYFTFFNLRYHIAARVT